MSKNKDLDNISAVPKNTPTESDDFDDLLQEIEAAGGEPEREIRARVYRVTENDRGKDLQEYCGAFKGVVDEEKIGRSFGSGKFRVYYDWRNKAGERKQTTRAVNIGREFAGAFEEKIDQKPAQAEPAPAFSISSIIGGLTVEKVTTIIAAIEGVKKLLAPPPPPPQIDFVKLLEVVNAMKPQGQNVSDAIVLKAMDLQKPVERQKTLSEQLRELQEAKETINALTDGANENGGDNMNVWLKMGLEMLPMLLKANGGNYKAAGAVAREIPKVNELLANDPELAQEFISAAALKYGDAAASELAAGFGYEMTRETPQAEQATPEETPAAITAEGSAQNDNL